MSMRSWQQTVGTIGFLVSLTILGQVTENLSIELGITFILMYISGAFLGYGLIVPHDKDCMCMECGTKKIIKHEQKKRVKN